MITFEPFWQTIKVKGISQYALIHEYGFGTGLLDNLRHDRSVTLNTLNEICEKLDCDITDVIKYTPE